MAAPTVQQCRPCQKRPSIPAGSVQQNSSDNYNARPQWLADAHAALDAAVAGAYGWPADISNDDALRELLALNGSR